MRPDMLSAVVAAVCAYARRYSLDWHNGYDGLDVEVDVVIRGGWLNESSQDLWTASAVSPLRWGVVLDAGPRP